jgi:hypothetical protein
VASDEWDWSRHVVDHLEFHASDYDASVRFYATVLEPLEIPLVPDRSQARARSGRTGSCEDLALAAEDDWQLWACLVPGTWPCPARPGSSELAAISAAVGLVPCLAPDRAG